MNKAVVEKLWKYIKNINLRTIYNEFEAERVTKKRTLQTEVNFPGFHKRKCQKGVYQI